MEYLDSIKPTTQRDVFRRWLFAFLSIHTTWKNNVRGFNALKDLEWLEDRQALLARLKGSGAGLYNNRTNFIWSFTQRFWNSPDRYSNGDRNLRDTFVTELNGIGFAKVSFALELIEGTKSLAICLDRHVLRWITGSDKENGHMGRARYRTLETKWRRACHDTGINAVIARYALWDMGQGQDDMRYWSHVFET